MTSKLIRRLIDCGCSPDTASNLCCVYIRDASLADLDSMISIMEAETDVDKIQSFTDRQKCGRLLSAGNFKSLKHKLGAGV